MSPSKVSLLNKFGFAGVALLSIILAAGVLTAGAWLVKEKADQMVSSQAEQIALHIGVNRGFQHRVHIIDSKRFYSGHEGVPFVERKSEEAAFTKSR